ncbi:hypothetical protein CERSUDRAFT_22932, partial [Gelatoporia subvermispora B]
LVDKDGVVFAVFVGRPAGGESWQALFAELDQLLKQFRSSMSLKCEDHRRGTYATISTGYSFGGGRTVPMNIARSPRRHAALRKLCSHPVLQRLVGFARSAFTFYMPKLYKKYVDCIMSLEKRDPTLQRPFECSPFPAASFNFPPHTVTYEHVDAENLADGICIVYAGGCFDYRAGGHLLLRQLGIAVEFPPTTLAIIPSASILHGNVNTQPGEERWSFTQYAAGDLFRYEGCGFR